MKKMSIEMICVIIGLIIALIGGTPGILSIIDSIKKNSMMTFNINNMNIGNIKQNDKMQTMVLIDLTVTNKGNNPLTPVAYTLKAKYRNQWLQLNQGFLPAEMQYFSCTPQKLLINLNKSIDLNLFHEPIAYGSPVSGYLVFFTDSIEINQISDIEITSFDIFKNKYKFKSSVKNLKNQLNRSLFRPTMSKITYLKEPAMTIRDSAKQYIDVVLANLNSKKNYVPVISALKNSTYYPAHVFFLIGSNGTAILFDGESDKPNFLFEFHNLDMPVQDILFEEDIKTGSASVYDFEMIFEGLQYTQTKAMDLMPTLFKRMEGNFGFLTDRFFDITPKTNIRFIGCTFAFVRRNNNVPEIQTFPFLYITSIREIALLPKSLL